MSTYNIPYSKINYSDIKLQLETLAARIEERSEELITILLKYESYEVAKDEIERTLDLLRSIDENKSYFKYRIGATTSFLPRNQPLYALSCFVIIPSLMSEEVHFRIPRSMKGFLSLVLDCLDVHGLFPNIFISHKERLEFMRDRTALLVDPKNGLSRPVTDAVIFTGTSEHADQLRFVFDKRTLFMANGSGHNPVVVSSDADVDGAVDAVLELGLYNQGQDCASPNAILVHEKNADSFLKKIKKKITNVKIGEYSDRSCKVGPISDFSDLKRVGALLVDNFKYLDPNFGGRIDTVRSIIEPTIILKPLLEGGNYTEIFAPIFFIQIYEKDSDLELYFENTQYYNNAMYVMLYGNSTYLKSLINKPVGKKVLLKDDTLLRDKHLHERGVERGTQPYGGYGKGASSFSMNGEVYSKPTLPQREIYEQLIAPLVESKRVDVVRAERAGFTEMAYKNVARLSKLGLKIAIGNGSKEISAYSEMFFDIENYRNSQDRFIRLTSKNLHTLISSPNYDHISKLKPANIKALNSLKLLLRKKHAVDKSDFSTLVYLISKEYNGENGTDQKKSSSEFFKSLYRLLFGTDTGPQLSSFLMEVDDKTVDFLLDV